MSETTRRILLSCLVLIVVACLCLSAVALASALGLVFTQIQSFQPTLPNLPAVASTPTVTPTVQVMTEAEIQAKMEEIELQVSKLRGLEPKRELKRAFLTPEELRQRVISDFLKDYTPEEIQNDIRTLAAFGLLTSDFDLRNFLVELYSEQIAGFYDRETGEMFIVKGVSFLGPERMTYAHEYTHALQDQNYDIENGLNYSEEACEEDTERCAAILALLEGDASLTEMSWLRSWASIQERKEIFDFYQNLKSPVYENAPEYLKADFLFPYEQGLAFVETLYDQGGWSAVNQAYINLPTTTEQILHPEKYPVEQPIDVSLPDLTEVLGSKWEEIDKGVLGEWYTYLVLGTGIEESYRLPEKQAQRAAEGWGGDAYIVYYNDDLHTAILILSTVWDDEKEAQEFFKAFADYGNRRFGQATEKQQSRIVWDNGLSVSLIRQNGLRTTWILAPNMELLHQISDRIENQTDAP